MIRTQIYLTEREQEGIRELSRSSGKGQSELIRNAIDEFLAKEGGEDRLQRLRSARGMWKRKKSIPNVRKLREEFERR